MTQNRQGPDYRAGEALQALYWGDEILQVMYWLLGEGFGKEVTIGDILRFVDCDEDTMRRHLDKLVGEGYTERLSVEAQQFAQIKYRLTETGTEEGKRRFAEEFEPMLYKHGHGECGRPDCWCHQLPSDETCLLSPEESRGKIP